MIPNNYKLIAEHPHSYELHDAKDGRSFHIAKHPLNLAMHVKISKMPKYAKGGELTLPRIPSTMVAPNAIIDPNEVAPVDTLSAASQSVPFSLSGMAPTINPTPEEVEAPSDVIEYPQGEIIDQKLLKKVAKKTEPETTGESPKEVEENGPDVNQQIIQALSQDDLKKALEVEKGSLQRANRAEQIEGQEKEAAYKQLAEKQAELVSPLEYQRQAEERSRELQNALQRSEIDPSRLFKKMDTGHKILSGIGLFLGGVGAGQYGDNRALKILDNAIDRDIDAQKNDQSKIMNLYKMNLAMTRSHQLAQIDTRMQFLEATKTMLGQADAKAFGPVAESQRAQGIAAIDGQLSDLSKRKALYQAAQHVEKTGGLIDVDPTYYLDQIKDPHVQREAAKEITEMKQLKILKDDMMRVQQELEKLPVGGYLDYKKKAALINAFAPRLSKLSEGKFTDADAKATVEAFFKTGFEGGETTQERRRLLDDKFKALFADTNFKSGTKFGLDLFAPTHFQERPIQPIEEVPRIKVDRNEAKKYIRENITSSDPAKQQRARYWINKLGLGQ